MNEDKIIVAKSALQISRMYLEVFGDAFRVLIKSDEEFCNKFKNCLTTWDNILVQALGLLDMQGSLSEEDTAALKQQLSSMLFDAENKVKNIKEGK